MSLRRLSSYPENLRDPISLGEFPTCILNLCLQKFEEYKSSAGLFEYRSFRTLWIVFSEIAEKHCVDLWWRVALRKPDEWNVINVLYSSSSVSAPAINQMEMQKETWKQVYYFRLWKSSLLRFEKKIFRKPSLVNISSETKSKIGWLRAVQKLFLCSSKSVAVPPRTKQNS